MLSIIFALIVAILTPQSKAYYYYEEPQQPQQVTTTTTTTTTTTKPPITTTKPPITTTKPPITTTKPPITATKPSTTTTLTSINDGFHPADLSLDVRFKEEDKKKPEKSAILFPGSEGAKCGSGTVCLSIDQCPAGLRGESICGWDENIPLICCSTSDTTSAATDGFPLTRDFH